jgi:hypothetical protein
MFRRLFAGLLGAAVVLTAGLPGTPAQDKKKDQPKKAKKERVAVNDPAKAKDDPDFLIQGEYAGEVMVNGENRKVGVQVVAQGGGKFAVKLFHGGLPGAGWDGDTPKAGTAARDGDKAVIKEDKGMEVAEVTGGSVVVKAPASGTLKKVERKSPTLGAKPPEGATVLFGGPGDEKNWNNGKLVELSDGKFLNAGVTTRQPIKSAKVHVEFRTPWMPNSTGQGRGNSGVIFQNRYEVQVLDSFGLEGKNNECGAIYSQHKPLVNMCLPPLTWQTFDIEFTAAEWADGKRTKPARATVFHNGVKVHDNAEIKGPTAGGTDSDKPGPLQLQNHGDPVAYNNVWVVEVK